MLKNSFKTCKVYSLHWTIIQDYFWPGPANYYLAMVSRGREERGGEEGRAGQGRRRRRWSRLITYGWSPHPHLLTRALNLSMVVTLCARLKVKTTCHRFSLSFWYWLRNIWRYEPIRTKCILGGGEPIFWWTVWDPHLQSASHHQQTGPAEQQTPLSPLQPRLSPYHFVLTTECSLLIISTYCQLYQLYLWWNVFF